MRLLGSAVGKNCLDGLLEQRQCFVDNCCLVAVGDKPGFARVVVDQHPASDQFSPKLAEELAVELTVAAVVGGRLVMAEQHAEHRGDARDDLGDASML